MKPTIPGLWVLDKSCGFAHKVGIDTHDSMYYYDNELTYCNMQNGGVAVYGKDSPDHEYRFLTSDEIKEIEKRAEAKGLVLDYEFVYGIEPNEKIVCEIYGLGEKTEELVTYTQREENNKKFIEWIKKKDTVKIQ